MGRLLAGSNTSFYSTYYYFGLVRTDPDDNKFADVYLASNANYLVTNDKQLLDLNNLAFPPIVAITLQRFSEMLRKPAS